MSNQNKDLKKLKEVCLWGGVMAVCFGLILIHKGIIPMLTGLSGKSLIPLWALYMTPILIVIATVLFIYNVNKKQLLKTDAEE